MTEEMPLGLHYLQQEFHQDHLLPADEFIRRLELRGVSIRKNDLEKWEEEGVLMPYFHMARRLNSEPGGLKYSGILQSADYYRGRLEEGGLTFPETSSFRPWSSFEDGDEESTIIFYHPLQMFTVRRLDAFLNVKVAMQALADVENWPSSHSEFYKRRFEFTLEGFKKNADKESKMQRLLISVGDRYLPRVRRQFSFQEFDIDNILRRYYEWYDCMDVAAIVSAMGLSIDDIRVMYERLARDGNGIDPLSRWYLLVRHMRHQNRRELKGEALFAQDYYDRAYVLKLLLQELGEVDIPEPDDVTDGRQGSWKPGRYGQMVDYTSRDVLKKILQEFGLDRSHRIHVFIEDESGLEATKIIAVAMGIHLEANGIHIERIGSSSKLYHPTFVNRLNYIRSEGTIPFLVVDNENDSHGQCRALQKDGFLDECCTCIWKEEFESDNWTDEQLITTLDKMAIDEGTSITITVDDLEDYRQLKVAEGKPIPKVTKAIDAILVQRGFSFLIRDRKVTFNKKLAELTARRIQAEIAENTYNPESPIEKELKKIVDFARYGLPRSA